MAHFSPSTTSLHPTSKSSPSSHHDRTRIAEFRRVSKDNNASFAMISSNLLLEISLLLGDNDKLVMSRDLAASSNKRSATLRTGSNSGRMDRRVRFLDTSSVSQGSVDPPAWFLRTQHEEPSQSSRDKNITKPGFTCRILQHRVSRHGGIVHDTMASNAVRAGRT